MSEGDHRLFLYWCSIFLGDLKFFYTHDNGPFCVLWTQIHTHSGFAVPFLFLSSLKDIITIHNLDYSALLLNDALMGVLISRTRSVAADFHTVQMVVSLDRTKVMNLEFAAKDQVLITGLIMRNSIRERAHK